MPILPPLKPSLPTEHQVQREQGCNGLTVTLVMILMFAAIRSSRLAVMMEH